MRTAIARPCGIALAAFVSAALGQQPPTADETKEANLKAYVEMLRKDVKKEKVSILSELMSLSPDESSKFWPVYNEYDKSLTAIADERIALIRMYAENYGSITDQMATKLATGVLDIEAKRTQLKRQYFQRISQALSAKIAARFLQIENQLEKILDLQISSSLPIVE